ERVRVGALDLRVALFGHDRSEEHLIWLETHDALPLTASRAACVTSTERAQTSAATSSSPGVTTTARSRLRNDLLTFCSSSPATTTSGYSLPHEPSRSTALRVDGSEKPEPSRTPKVPLAASCERPARSAERRALRFTFTLKSRVDGGNATPPPVQCGARVVPARARPVPFWRHGFERPAATSARFLAARVPRRSAFSAAGTVSCTMCGFTSAANTDSSSVTSFFVEAPSSGALGAAISGPLPAESCARAAKRRSRKDAGSARSRRLRVRPRTTRERALQRRRACEADGWAPPCLRLLPHFDVGVLRAGDGALDEQQIALPVHVVNDEPDLRHALTPEAAGHAHALEDARRRRRRADRSRLADVVRAVRRRPAVELVPLDRSGKALAVRDAGDLHLLARLERLDGDVLADDERALAAQLEQPAVRAADRVLLPWAGLGLPH